MESLGNIANIAQLTGLDAIKLIGLIAQAAEKARTHKKNCQSFATHLKLIGNLLEQLKLSELRKYPETRDPLEQLEDALRRSYVLVKSCQDRSYLYLLAMGWNIVHQFRKAQDEIDQYLKLVPLINLVVDNNHNKRVTEGLEDIEKDQHEYTLDEEDIKLQGMVRNKDQASSAVLKKSLSRSYPQCSFNDALKKENEKLRIELQLSKANSDVQQYEVIQGLLDVTATLASICQLEQSSMESGSDHISFASRMASSGQAMQSRPSSFQHEERGWHTDLLDCCAEPCLCLKTFVCPCATYSKTATFVNNRSLSSMGACNKLFLYALILSCCCTTCCVRRKLRLKLNIPGSACDDFWTHLCCCCCALVQEERELKIRGLYNEKTMTMPPPTQVMYS